MKITHNVDASMLRPIHVTKKSEEIIAIEEFIKSENENICFEYEDADTARKRRNNIAANARKEGLDVRAVLRENRVIVIRSEKKNTGE